MGSLPSGYVPPVGGTISQLRRHQGHHLRRQWIVGVDHRLRTPLGRLRGRADSRGESLVVPALLRPGDPISEGGGSAEQLQRQRILLGPSRGRMGSTAGVPVRPRRPQAGDSFVGFVVLPIRHRGHHPPWRRIARPDPLPSRTLLGPRRRWAGSLVGAHSSVERQAGDSPACSTASAPRRSPGTTAMAAMGGRYRGIGRSRSNRW